jgi:transposase-like protein
METIVNNMDKFVMDEDYALRLFKGIRWVNGVYCPKCKSFHVHSKGSRGSSTRYQCPSCGNNFSDFTDTPFEYSKIPFGKMLYILIHIGTKSVVQLSKELNLHRNTVGRYHKRIREYLLENHVDPSFDGEIEMDEVYIIAGEKGVKKTQK